MWRAAAEALGTADRRQAALRTSAAICYVSSRCQARGCLLRRPPGQQQQDALTGSGTGILGLSWELPEGWPGVWGVCWTGNQEGETPEQLLRATPQTWEESRRKHIALFRRCWSSREALI